MAFTADQIANLEKMIASGVTSAGYGDKRTEFRSLAEMRQLLAQMKAEVAGKKGNRQIRIATVCQKRL